MLNFGPEGLRGEILNMNARTSDTLARTRTRTAEPILKSPHVENSHQIGPTRPYSFDARSARWTENTAPLSHTRARAIKERKVKA